MRYAWPYWRLAAAAVVITIVSGLASLLGPWPMKVLVDSVLGDHPLPQVIAWLVGSLQADRISLLLVVVFAGLGITLLDGVLGVVSNYVLTKLEQRMVLDFRSELFQHAQRLSFAFHDQRKTGDLMVQINFASTALGSVATALLPLAQAGLTLVGMFSIAFSIDRQLAMLSLIVVPFIYYSIGYYATHIEPQVRRVRGIEGASMSIVHEAMAMLRVIVAFGREDYEHHRFRQQGEDAVAARVNLTVRQTLFSLVVNTTTAVGTALVLGVGAYHVLQGGLTVGQLLIVLAYIAAVYSPLRTISSRLGSLQEQAVNVQMAFELLDVVPEIKDSPRASAVRRARGNVTFDAVSFGYHPRTDALKGIAFEAKAGQVVAIVGPTGAGKSTLVSLIPRFYDPRRGRVLIDGTDIRDLTVKSVRQQISMVLQEPLLFSGSVVDNIRYGRLDAGMAEIVDAARAANAHEFILRMPQGYDTVLGERGAQLSGGERQRISIARAFLKDARILVLDEPTSSIDSKTEAVILEALDRLMVGRTTFLIAHRLSTIRNADVIVVLNHGELVEQGTHEELLQRGGLYTLLHDTQTRQARRPSRPALTVSSVVNS